MKSLSNYKNLSSEDILDRIIEADLNYEAAIKDGDAKKATKHTNIAIVLEAELINRDQLLMLKKLFTNNDVNVKISAAAILLHVIPEEAEKILEEIIYGPFVHGQGRAEIIFHSFRAGDIEKPKALTSEKIASNLAWGKEHGYIK